MIFETTYEDVNGLEGLSSWSAPPAPVAIGYPTSADIQAGLNQKLYAMGIDPNLWLLVTSASNGADSGHVYLTRGYQSPSGEVITMSVDAYLPPRSSTPIVNVTVTSDVKPAPPPSPPQFPPAGSKTTDNMTVIDPKTGGAVSLTAYLGKTYVVTGGELANYGGIQQGDQLNLVDAAGNKVLLTTDLMGLGPVAKGGSYQSYGAKVVSLNSTPVADPYTTSNGNTDISNYDPSKAGLYSNLELIAFYMSFLSKLTNNPLVQNNSWGTGHDDVTSSINAEISTRGLSYLPIPALPDGFIRMSSADGKIYAGYDWNIPASAQSHFWAAKNDVVFVDQSVDHIGHRVTILDLTTGDKYAQDYNESSGNGDSDLIAQYILRGVTDLTPIGWAAEAANAAYNVEAGNKTLDSTKPMTILDDVYGGAAVAVGAAALTGGTGAAIIASAISGAAEAAIAPNPTDALYGAIGAGAAASAVQDLTIAAQSVVAPAQGISPASDFGAPLSSTPSTTSTVLSSIGKTLTKTILGIVTSVGVGAATNAIKQAINPTSKTSVIPYTPGGNLIVSPESSGTSTGLNVSSGMLVAGGLAAVLLLRKK